MTPSDPSQQVATYRSVPRVLITGTLRSKVLLGVGGVCVVGGGGYSLAVSITHELK